MSDPGGVDADRTTDPARLDIDMTTKSFLTTGHTRLLMCLAVAGGLVLVAGCLFAPERIWGNVLVGTFYLLTLALGGAVFVALTYVTGAGWPVAFRRVPEAMARTIPFAGLALLITLAMRMNEYGWHHHGEGDPGTFWFKEAWLQPSLWIGRSVIYILIWSVMAGWICKRSRMQDETRHRTPKTTLKLQ